MILCYGKLQHYVIISKKRLSQILKYIFGRLGNLKDAIKCYSQALKLDSSFTEAYIGRANVYTEYLTIEGNQKAK